MVAMVPLYPSSQRHSETREAPADGVRESDGQLLGLASPGVQYWPSGQSVQVPPSTPENPVLHAQSVSASLSASELLSAGQDRQAPDPAPALYVPTAHPVHCVLPVPVKPGSHRQSSADAAACPESESPVHVWHAPSPVWSL